MMPPEWTYSHNVLWFALTLFATSMSVVLVSSCILYRDWRKLIATYPERSMCTGHWLHNQSMMFRASQLDNCVSICFTDEYLHLKFSPVFFFSRRELQIPWTDVISVSQQKRRMRPTTRTFLLKNRIVFTFTVTPAFEMYMDSHAKQIGQTRLLQFDKVRRLT
jgi:hypothetical protein